MTPYILYLFIVAIRRFSYTTGYTLFAVYLLTVVGTGPFELVLPGFFYELAIFLFEIPTGVIADIYSRRLSIIIGYALMGSGFIVSGLIPSLSVVTIGLIILGTGSTFVSGALSAWLVDEVGQERASQAFMRGTQVSTIARLAGIIVSVILGSVNLQLATMGAGIPMLATALLLVFIMPETGFQPMPMDQRASWRNLFATFRQGLKFVRASQMLLAMFVIILVFAGYSETFGKLWQAHILANFTLPGLGDIDDIVWFGIIGIVSIPVTLLATEWLRKQFDLEDARTVVRLLNGLFVMLSISGLLFAFSGHFILMLSGIWGTQVIIALIAPLMEIWLNQHVEPRIRATLLSIVGQVNSFGEIIVGGPIAGIMASLFTVRIAIATTALFLLPLTLVFRRVPKLF
jgi:DHA3 family tetracycline resistance protein-like MFS transporter